MAWLLYILNSEYYKLHFTLPSTLKNSRIHNSIEGKNYSYAYLCIPKHNATSFDFFFFTL